MEMLKTLLKDLTDLDGVSGDEGRVRAYINSLIHGHVDEIQEDALGNLIVFKKGAQTPKNKIMVDAHMDEVGFMVLDIDKSGLLRFTPIGGIDTRTMFSSAVRIHSSLTDDIVYGNIAFTSIHDVKDELALPEQADLRIDIGAKDAEEAKQYVRPGDTVCFDSDFVLFGDGKIKAKAIDDRAGCALMIDTILNYPLKYDTYFAFTVQEETGLIGAKTAAFQVDPDYSISLESTTAADIGNVPEEKQVCNQGQGPVISFKDTRTIYPRELYELAFSLGEKHNITLQPKRLASGGNNAGAIQESRGGVKVIAISLPCRYIHSASSMIDEKDLPQTRALLHAFLDELGDRP